jgi:hypothetical protein
MAKLEELIQRAIGLGLEEKVNRVTALNISVPELIGWIESVITIVTEIRERDNGKYWHGIKDLWTFADHRFDGCFAQMRE